MQDIQTYMLQTKEERQRHINLDTSCCDRGGDSIQFRGLLAYFLDTNIPSGAQAYCCHACNNGDCSNPLHLYWGTSAENKRDRIELEETSGVRKQVIKHLSDRMIRDKNPNYQVKPWNNILGNTESWLKAGEIYDKLVKQHWDFSKHGQGPSYLQHNFNIAQGSSKTMIKMFRKGWNPWEDNEWISFYQKQLDMVDRVV